MIIFDNFVAFVKIVLVRSRSVLHPLSEMLFAVGWCGDDVEEVIPLVANSFFMVVLK